MPGTVGGNKGVQVESRPRQYEEQPQHTAMKKVHTFCGIEEGVSKKFMQRSMEDCVSPLMKAWGDDEIDLEDLDRDKVVETAEEILHEPEPFIERFKNQELNGGT